MAVPDPTVWALVRGLFSISRQVRRATRESPIDPVAIGVLNLAGALGSVRPSTVAAELDAAPQSVTRQVHGLEDRGWVRLIADESDGRSYQIELTEAGQAELSHFRASLTQDYRQLLADWSDEEIAVFAAQTERFADALAQSRRDQEARPRRPNRWRTAKGHP
jgi:DNA-binding MarR family transcriptional regulator